MFQFLKSKAFFINVAIYIVVLLGLFWGVLTWLGSYTSHGQSVKVPDFTGAKIAALDNVVGDINVSYQIIDSVYDAKKPKGTVVRQEPEPNAEVKEGRTIYLYVTSTQPPAVQMPKLIDRSLRQAVTMITTYGFKLGTVTYVPDQCANCVLDQMVKGQKIAPGANVSKGAVISLIVGKGLGNEEVGIPCLVGLSRSEAIVKLTEASLNIGAIAYDNPKDTTAAKIYRQIPGCSRSSVARLGGSVDVFLTTDKTKLPASADSTAAKETDNSSDFDN